MKILHVIPGISRGSGGPSRSAQGLVSGLNRAGVEAWLLSLTNDEDPWVEGIKNFVSEEPFENIVALMRPDLVHLHCLWNWGIHRCAVICRKCGIKYVVSPRGMLDPWALSVKKWKKRVARWLYQDRDLRGAAALHATAELESEHIRALGFTNSIIISPNGIDVGKCCQCGNIASTNVANDQLGVMEALFMGRLHPGKGLLTLAEAWGKLGVKSEGVGSDGVKGWKMVVVGPDSYGHKKDIVAKLEALGIREQWEFVDMVDDRAKWTYYRNADLLIHPSVSENFGITIAEGLSAGLPVICTKGTPWKDLADYRCGWWIDIGVEPLVKALEEAMRLSDEARQEMGARGRKLVEEKYTVDAAVKAMVKGYEEILK